jgi:uncharacterized protein
MEDSMSKVVHTELITNDPKATADFVDKMFGWQVKKWGDDNMTYYVWNYPGEQMGGGGIAGLSDQLPQKGPHISIYIDVDNIAAAIKKAKSLGATQMIGETAIGDGMGYFAMISAPGGCVLGLWCLKPSK